MLQNSPPVHEETRVLMRKAMADIGYVYNRAAANMRMSKAGLIGLVINDLRNPFFTEFATSLQMALAERGYLTVIARGGFSTMQMLRRVDERLDLFPLIAPDYLSGSRDATRHLIAAGPRRVAFVGGITGRAVVRERMSGYLAGLQQAGIDPVIVPGRPSRAFGREAARILTQDYPNADAAICFNDLVALGVLNGFAEQGRPVGPSFRLVGFDDIEECAQAYPALSSVRCNIAGFGKSIASTILRWLEAGHAPSAEVLTDVEMVVRASSA